MDSDRKYSQRGYQESDRRSSNGNGSGDRRPKPQGPRPALDVTGPRLPRLVQSVVASRCFNCAGTLPADLDFSTSQCPKCNAVLHCCKQCAHFEPSTRFQCLKPVPVRIAGKDVANECALFSPRVTVARDSAPVPASSPAQLPHVSQQPPRTPQDARAAFDSLFKK